MNCLHNIFWVVIVLLVADSSALSQNHNDEPVDFERQVAPLFSRLGCNSAACHGAFDGKGGMQFSLFGYSAEMDFKNLQPRIDLDDPTDSLMLLKPTAEEAHEGGKLFGIGSKEYKTIKAWIEQGATWTKGSGKVKRLNISRSKVVFKFPSPSHPPKAYPFP